METELSPKGMFDLKTGDLLKCVHCESSDLTKLEGSKTGIFCRSCTARNYPSHTHPDNPSGWLCFPPTETPTDTAERRAETEAGS